jgi:4-amino-4-deoxy-L-arabinose transferase-like glycosyltransferase
VSRRSPWLDPTSTRVAVALAILAAIANGVWILLDHSVPSWDQSHYLSTTLEYQRAFQSGGLIDLLRSINDVDTSHGPLFTILMLPFIRIFGASNSSGLALNLVIAPVLYFSAGEIAWVLFRSWVARLLTIVLVATMPLMVGLFHNVLQDFLLVTLATLSLLLLLKSEGFQRRWMTWGMALAMGLGTLTKVTFPAFVAGPLLVVVVGVVASALAKRRGRADTNFDGRQLVINLGGAAFVYLVVAFAWYGPNFSATVDYVRSTTSGPLSEGAGPSDPLTFDAITSFTTGVVNSNLSWVILLLGLVAVALNGGRLKALFSRPLRWEPLQKLAFLLAWALIPYLSVVTAHNQDVRLMAPALPAVAILVAVAIAAVRWRGARIALASVAVVVLSYQTLTHITDVTPGFMPDQVKVEIDDYVAVIQLDSQPTGYEQLPGDDYGNPVIEYIEEVASVEPGGLALPRSVCLLESEAVINSNTMGFLAAAREDPFVFMDVAIGPEVQKGLETALSSCNFALYVKQPEVSPAGQESRLVLVNDPYAANHMTPRLFRLFRGPSRVFPTAPVPEGAEPGYLSANGGTQVRVLVRTPGEG